LDSLQDTLARNQEVGVLSEGLSLMLNRQLPLAYAFLPQSLRNSMIQFHIAVKIPLLCGCLDVVLNLVSGSIEVAPIRVRIEWESL
jgi:hypothetical protein